MNITLLPVYKKALKNDPEAILEMGERLLIGKDTVHDTDKAAEWFEKLLNFKQKFENVDYAQLYYWSAIAAFNRDDLKTALKRFRKAFKLFKEQYPDKEELAQVLDKEGFLEWYGKTSLYYALKLV